MRIVQPNTVLTSPASIAWSRAEISQLQKVGYERLEVSSRRLASMSGIESRLAMPRSVMPYMTPSDTDLQIWRSLTLPSNPRPGLTSPALCAKSK